MKTNWPEVDEKLQGIVDALELKPPDWSATGSLTEEVTIRLPHSVFEKEPVRRAENDLAWEQIQAELHRLSAAIQKKQHAAALEHLQAVRMMLHPAKRRLLNNEE